MKIGIIECGPVPGVLQAKYVSYPAMFEAQLRPLLPNAAFTTISVVNGEPLPAPDACDAWLIPGSRHGVYDPLPWIEPLKAFIREVARLKRPMAGVCFGHQIIAEALGGKVEKAAIGFRIGMEQYETTLGGNGPRNVTMPAFHQDQIVVQPPNSDVVASTAACTFAALRYRDAPILSVQFHPEFSMDYLADLIDCMGQQAAQPGLSAGAAYDGAGMRWIAAALAGEMMTGLI
ncbi:type 1 glutamine amidotransferase [uncultured Ferrovibrio sp.]|jgi:GMP synthase-like glutamine amidotransferase|uniref:type 1 glutamine amidotransferase n=1 Tax=uncultured Ferrovibrio sp. TaxID=1576913 RepID=UPI002608FC14|nr:type 1 glutamine amidotransferase [uncultured Ferrovibrio sp.]